MPYGNIKLPKVEVVAWPSQSVQLAGEITVSRLIMLLPKPEVSDEYIDHIGRPNRVLVRRMIGYADDEALLLEASTKGEQEEERIEKTQKEIKLYFNPFDDIEEFYKVFYSTTVINKAAKNSVPFQTYLT